MVESSISVWWLTQCGISNVVSFMGSSMSNEQKKLIEGYFGRKRGGIFLMFDPDTAGEKGMQKCLWELSAEIYVKRINLKPIDKKPHQLTPEELKTLCD